MTINSGLTLGTALTVANGGTGANTLTGIVIGNGTSALTGVTTSCRCRRSPLRRDWYRIARLCHNPTLQGFFSNASSTIGNGTQAGGLTIFGGATTTGNAYFAGNVGLGTTTPGSILSINGVGNFSSATSTLYGNLSVVNFNVTGTATSTHANGINLSSGCFSINGTCVGGAAAPAR